MANSRTYKCHRCGCLKFYASYARAWCRVCGTLVPWLIAGNTVFMPIDAPAVEDVVMLSDTD